jgi:hypothetical protein
VSATSSPPKHTDPDLSSISQATNEVELTSSDQLIAILQRTAESCAPRLDSDVSQGINTLLAKLISRRHPGTSSTSGATNYLHSSYVNAPASGAVECSDDKQEPGSAHIAPSPSLPYGALSTVYK